MIISDVNSGVLRIWNVSKSTPVESIRMKKTGFHSLLFIEKTVLHQIPRCDRPDAVEGESDHSDLLSSPTKSSSTSFTMPSGQVLCTFTDGGVGLYDLRQKKWSFLRDMVTNIFGRVSKLFRV